MLRVFLFVFLANLSVHAQDEGYFWHITDMHWDSTYSQSSKALSCNPGTTGTSFGRYGDFRCDPPWLLINSSVRAMRQLREDVDFLIWTGDDTPHIWDDEVLNPTWVSQIVLNLTEQILEVWPDKLVYSALGNHDWSPKNQLPPRNSPFYDVIADKWKSWFNNDTDAEETFRKAAYYTMKHGLLRIVVLNTNLLYDSNKEVTNMPDPANQLQWFDDVMRKAATDGEKVLVVGHVPPGQFEKHKAKYWYYPYYNEVLLALLETHSEQIGGIHMAHHHTDSFRLLYNKQGEAKTSIFLAPAVSPWETTLPGVMGGAGNNPSIRLVKYDRQTGATLDIYQYWLNLTAANSLVEQSSAHWQLEYQATEYYEVDDLATNSLHTLVDRLRADDAMFDKYYKANGVLYDPSEQWSEEMRTVHLCAITRLHYSNYTRCVQADSVVGRASSFTSEKHSTWIAFAVILFLIASRVQLCQPIDTRHVSGC